MTPSQTTNTPLAVLGLGPGVHGAAEGGGGSAGTHRFPDPVSRAEWPATRLELRAQTLRSGRPKVNDQLGPYMKPGKGANILEPQFPRL